MATPKKRKESSNSELSHIEKQIYDLETAYLEDTRHVGNIFIGWGGYSSTERSKKKKVINNEERLFSLSSVTSLATKKELKKEKATPNAKSGKINNEGIEIETSEIFAL